MIASGCMLVSYDFSNGKDKGVLLVGRQKDGVVDVVNAFQGEEAERLYMELVTMKPLPRKNQKTSFANDKMDTILTGMNNLKGE